MAHYDLKPPNMRTFDVSGNTLTIYEPFAHLALGEFFFLTFLDPNLPRSESEGTGSVL